MLKTFANWKGDLEDYLNIGDTVDEEMVEHFIDVLPPITLTYLLVQAGGPVDFVNGKNTFTTFARENGEWVYKGACHKGMNKLPYTIVKSIGKYNIIELFAHKDYFTNGTGEIYIAKDLAERYHNESDILTGYSVLGEYTFCIPESDDWYDSIEDAEKFIATLQQ